MYNVENIFNINSQKLHHKHLSGRRERKKLSLTLFSYILKKSFHQLVPANHKHSNRSQCGQEKAAR